MMRVLKVVVKELSGRAFHPLFHFRVHGKYVEIWSEAEYAVLLSFDLIPMNCFVKKERVLEFDGPLAAPF
jgi:hypothetical protein